MKYLFLIPLLCMLSCKATQKKPYYLQINSYEDIVTGNFDAIKNIFQQKDDTLYVINFWATWCKPCIEELPFFEELYSAYFGKPIKILLVSLDFPNQIESKLFPFIEKHQLKSAVIHLNDPDADSWINQVEPTWEGSIPATLIYRKTERKFYEKSFETYEELETIIHSFL